MIYLDEHIESIDVVAVLAEVSEQRRELAMRFLRESSRQQSLAAYLLLKKGLRMEYGIQENPILAFTADGKPFIENLLTSISTSAIRKQLPSAPSANSPWARTWKSYALSVLS